MLVPGCMWHVMHCAEGIDSVNSWRRGWPASSFFMVGSFVWLMPRFPKDAYGPEFERERSFAYTTWQAVQPLDR